MSTVQLYNDDCLSAMANLPIGSVDLLITDPPYNLGLFMKDRATNLHKMRSNFFGAAGWDNMEYSDWVQSMEAFFKAASIVLKKGGSVIVFMAIIKVETLISIAKNCGFYYKTTGIWHKKNPMPRNMNLQFINSTEAWVYFTYGARTGTFNNNGQAVHDFIETAVTSVGEKKIGKHPTQKPIALMRHFVELLTNEGDCVLDPFMGSGSSGIAAKQLNRNFIGIELNPTYYDLAKKRIVEALI